MQIPTLSSIKNKTNETYGDDDIKKHDSDSVEVMKLKTELFKVKQSKGNNEGNINSGLAYMLGLHNKTNNGESGLAYMLGSNKEKKSFDKFNMLGSSMNTDNKINSMLGNNKKYVNNKINNILGDKMSKNKTMFSNPFPKNNIKKPDINIKEIIGISVNKVKNTKPQINNFNSYFRMDNNINNANDKIRQFLGISNNINRQQNIMMQNIRSDKISPNGLKDKIVNFVSGKGFTDNETNLQTYGNKPIKKQKNKIFSIVKGKIEDVKEESKPINSIDPNYSYNIEQSIPENIVYKESYNDVNKQVSNKQIVQQDNLIAELEKQVKLGNLSVQGELNKLKLEKMRMEVLKAKKEAGQIPIKKTNMFTPITNAGNTMISAATSIPTVQGFDNKVVRTFGIGGGLGIDNSIMRIKQMSNIGGSGTGFYEMATVPSSQGTGFLEMMPGAKTNKFKEVLGYDIPEEENNIPEYIQRVKQARELKIQRQPIVVPVQQTQVRTPPPGKVIGAGGKIVSYTRGQYTKHS